MCRLLGVVSSEPTDYRFSLREAARSLQRLSEEHPHGWGLAVSTRERGWEHHRHLAPAHESERFRGLADVLRGEMLIAHVRKATVGGVSCENTHPFRQGAWVFAHNGTIGAVEELRSRASRERLAEIEGQTDSEVLFAFLLTALDVPGRDREAALARACSTLRRPEVGTSNFLLSDGATLYAHRSGRTLFTLLRGHQEAPPLAAADVLRRRRVAVLIASEPMTDEPWRGVEEGALLAIDAGASPHVRRVMA